MVALNNIFLVPYLSILRGVFYSIDGYIGNVLRESSSGAYFC